MHYRRGGFQKFLRLRESVRAMQRGSMLFVVRDDGDEPAVDPAYLALDHSCSALQWVDEHGRAHRLFGVSDISDVKLDEWDEAEQPGSSLSEASELSRQWHQAHSQCCFTVRIGTQGSLTIKTPTWRDLEIWFQGLSFFSNSNRQVKGEHASNTPSRPPEPEPWVRELEHGSVDGKFGAAEGSAMDETTASRDELVLRLLHENKVLRDTKEQYDRMLSDLLLSLEDRSSVHTE